MSEQIFLIENGYLDLHLWVTYKCAVGCPHCYLKAMTEIAPDLTVDKLKFLLDSIKSYREKWNLLRITIYGAEPQSLPVSYFHELIDTIDTYFDNAQYSLYTSLQKLDDDWLKLFKRIQDKNGLQMTAVSYDGLMRGEVYNSNLFNNLKVLSDNGMRVGMMSVVNRSLLELGANHYVDVLEKNNLGSFSLKPFLPIRGQYEKWERLAARMNEYSTFAIDVHKELDNRNLLYLSGMVKDTCHKNPVYQNIGGWVVFVDGNLRLLYMGYEKKQEYLQCFGIVNESASFQDVIEGSNRIKFLEDQRMLHNREDCLVCEHANRCLAEVFKDNYDDSDECIGASRFVNWAYDRVGSLYDRKVV